MAPDGRYDALAAELRALGRGARVPEPDDRLAVAVLSRIRELPSPPREAMLRRALPGRVRVAGPAYGLRRRAVVVGVAVLTALLLTPPVRAAVLDWFGFAGVVVRHDPAPEPRTAAPPPPTVSGTLSLGAARELVAFQPVLPTALGAPQGVEVSADRRLLSMSWVDDRGRPVRLDQFDGRLDYSFAKTSPGVRFVSVNDDFAMWFDRPHEVVVLNRDGSSRAETARLAGNTLIWQRGPVTLRLEGDLSSARAVEIAESAVPAPQ